MTHYYKVVPDYDRAVEIIDRLELLGVKRKDVHMMITQSMHADTSADTLMDQNVTVEKAPTGTINAFGASFAALTAVSASVAYFIAGPIAAAIVGTAVAGTGITMFLNGVGVPKEEHDEIIAQLEAGQIFIEVDSNDPKVGAVLG